MGGQGRMVSGTTKVRAVAGVGGRVAAGVPPGSHPASVGWSRAGLYPAMFAHLQGRVQLSMGCCMGECPHKRRSTRSLCDKDNAPLGAFSRHSQDGSGGAMEPCLNKGASRRLG